ncbi:MAG: protein kinase [Proteobacteria bacterium]|nr:protein kinase [Pseudomonadota bacterium]
MAEPSSRSKDDRFIGRLINGRFRIEAPVARGGMGCVYRAEQVPLGRTVALKILAPKYTGDKDPEFQSRFFLEAATAAKLTHPNTVTVFDYGRTEDGVFFIAMEFVEGKTLSQLLKEDGRLAPHRVLTVGIQICRALREAHGLSVVHRDLKPANILLVDGADEVDFVKVLDFGLVKNVNSPQDLTRTGMFMGSPKYVAPEQISGNEVDARTDIYSLGVMLFEMLEGRIPYKRKSQVETLMAHIRDPIPGFTRPDVPAELRRLVHRCMSKQPAERYASMDQLLDALSVCKEHVSPNPSEELVSGSASCLRLQPLPQPAAPIEPSPSLPAGALSKPVPGNTGTALLPASVSSSLPEATQPPRPEPLLGPPPPAAGALRRVRTKRARRKGPVVALLSAAAAIAVGYAGARFDVDGHELGEISRVGWQAELPAPHGGKTLPQVEDRTEPSSPTASTEPAAGSPDPLVPSDIVPPALALVQGPSGEQPPPEAQAQAQTGTGFEPAQEAPEPGLAAPEPQQPPVAAVVQDMDHDPNEPPAQPNAGEPAADKAAPVEPHAPVKTRASKRHATLTRRSARRVKRSPKPVKPAPPALKPPSPEKADFGAPGDLVPWPASGPAPEALAASEPAATESSKPAGIPVEQPIATGEKPPEPQPVASTSQHTSAVTVPRAQRLSAAARIAGLAVSGPLASSVIQRAIDRIEGRFAGCYARAAKKAGRNDFRPILVRFRVANAGRAQRVRASGSSLPGLHECIAEVTSALRTRRRPDVGHVQASFRIELRPRR